MESAESNQELLENVTISDVGGSQFMIQRMTVDNTQLLNAELLSHHGGLVVDLGAGDFIPVNYSSEDLLNQDLTEEDRNLAAALVAVQLSQQQKQQQLQQDSSSALPTIVANSTLGVPKIELSDQQIILTNKSGNTLNGRYLQIVGEDGVYETYDQEIKSEGENESPVVVKDSDGENRSDTRSSRKSLPHKKRISRKLKRNPVALRKYHKCSLCEQTFSSEDFAEHQTECHTTITPVNPTLFSCQLCQSNFQDQLGFFEHLKSHYEPSVQVEPAVLASEEEPTKEEIKIDINTPKESLLSSLLNLQCTECNKTFKRQKVYEAHVRDVHSKQELAEFSEPEDLMAGIDVVVGANEHSSDEDSKSWSKYRDEELHATEEDLRELEAQDHVCHICQEPFPMRAILLQHLTTCRLIHEQTENSIQSVPKKKTKKKPGELSCTDCDRVFAHRNSLIYHLRSHTGERPHQCEHCGKSFFAASALKVHMRLHSGDKPYKCEHCGRNFRQWGDLKYHTISLHSDQKQYQCEYCGKDFARKYSLIVHRRIHTGERNYKCEFCGKSFRASSYLQNHRRIHTGEKPHPCEVCGKPFRVRSDMKRHMKTHGRRRLVRSTPMSPELVVTKIEKSEDSIMIDSDDTSQLQTQESENAVEALQFEQTQLEAVREGNTLYTNGHQLFVLYTGDAQPHLIEDSSTWSQTS
ncbi:zinc finger protein 431-like [Photinus pyralis]|nr:zinc finger protein 431-like [Photinus pyralis]